METKDTINIVFMAVGIFSTVIIAIGGAWVVVKVLLAKHDGKLDHIEKSIEEIKEERKGINDDIKKMFVLMNKINTTVAVMDERTKNN